MKGKSKSEMPVVNPRAAGIDIGSEFHVCAVSPDLSPEPVQTFGTFTGDLHRMAQWLKICGITTIAMESTGVYWLPAYEILEAQGFEVYLVNAREARNVPGRKTDVNDAQWLQKLHQYGLLRASFRPVQEVATLRAYLRQRERLLEFRAAHIQHMQKAMMQMNVQLHHVVTDITGVTGLKIIRAIVAGEHDAQKLAALRDGRCKKSEATIAAALAGHYQQEHLFALRQAVELFDVYGQQIDNCDREIEIQLQRLYGPAPEAPLPKARHTTKQPNALAFDVRAALYQVAGVDLTQIHGLGPSLALKLVAECGLDMTRWPSSKHFASWLCLSPGNKISGGKVLLAKTRRSSSRAAAALRLAATTLGRTETALGAFYRRLSARVGKAKAVTATARKIAVLFYNTLRYGMSYSDPGANYYEEQHRQRLIDNLKRKAKVLGFTLHAGSPGVREGVS